MCVALILPWHSKLTFSYDLWHCKIVDRSSSISTHEHTRALNELSLYCGNCQL